MQQTANTGHTLPWFRCFSDNCGGEDFLEKNYPGPPSCFSTSGFCYTGASLVVDHILSHMLHFQSCSVLFPFAAAWAHYTQKSMCKAALCWAGSSAQLLHLGLLREWTQVGKHKRGAQWWHTEVLWDWGEQSRQYEGQEGRRGVREGLSSIPVMVSGDGKIKGSRKNHMGGSAVRWGLSQGKENMRLCLSSPKEEENIQPETLIVIHI